MHQKKRRDTSYDDLDNYYAKVIGEKKKKETNKLGH